MLDCLPTQNEWSPESQYAFLCDHLDALEHHIAVLQEAAQNGLNSLQTQADHFQEIYQRSQEAHQQLQHLLQLPSEVQAKLSQKKHTETP